MTPALLTFLAGLAASLHCVGMCGGFVCGLGGSPARQLLYNLGRLASYGFIGALAGHAGAFVVELCGEGWSLAGQRALALLSGGLMIVVGLQFAGLLRHVAPAWPGRLGAALVRLLRPLLQAPGIAAPLALGALNGWLPCPLVYAFAAQAAASGGAMSGLQLMLCFGLGTFPAMLLMGGLGLWWRRPAVAGGSPLRFVAHPGFDARLVGVRLGGLFLMLLGCVTLARGLLPMTTAMVH